MSFIEKYNQFKQKYLIVEGTVKSMIPQLQQKLLGDKKWVDLNDEEKKNINDILSYSIKHIEERVNSITSNKQYQSWLYDILAKGDKNINEDYEVIKQCIEDFEKLCKRPDLQPQQRNIQTYKQFSDLQQFILDFQNNHKLQQNVFNKFFQLIVEDSKYAVYKIAEDQYEQCHLLFGGVDLDNYFNTGWCVAKNKEYFDRYIQRYNTIDKTFSYFVWINKQTNKPYGLLHFGSFQFKDPSDYCIENFDDFSLFVKLVHTVKKQLDLDNILIDFLNDDRNDFVKVFGNNFIKIFNYNINELFVKYYNKHYKNLCALDKNNNIVLDFSVLHDYYCSEYRQNFLSLFNNITISDIKNIGVDNISEEFLSFLISKMIDNKNIINKMFFEAFKNCCKMNEGGHIEIVNNFKSENHRLTPLPKRFIENKVDIDYIDSKVVEIYNPHITSSIFMQYYKDMSANEIFCRQFPKCRLNNSGNIECYENSEIGTEIPCGYFNNSKRATYTLDINDLKLTFDVFEYKLLSNREFALELVKRSKTDKNFNQMIAQIYPDLFTYDQSNNKLNVIVDSLWFEDDFIKDGKIAIDLHSGSYRIYIKDDSLQSFEGFPKQCSYVKYDGYNSNSLTSLKGLPKCEVLALSKAKNITDFSPIDPNTKRVSLDQCKKLKSLSQISHINYQQLNISSTGITSLEGLNNSCNSLVATFCKLTSLKGIPNHKFKAIVVNKCKTLISLEGSPDQCDYFDCSRTAISDLKGISKNIGSLIIDGCLDLNSFKYHPQSVKDVSCRSGTPLLRNREFVRWRNQQVRTH